MKFIAPVLLFTILSTTGHSQSRSREDAETGGIGMGLSGGYSSKQRAVGTLTLGVILPARTQFSMNMTVLSGLRSRDIPSIFESRVSHFFNTVEIYGGAAYHIAGSDNKITANPNSGLKAAFGIVKHFYRLPWTIAAGMSGNIFSVQLGVFSVR